MSEQIKDDFPHFNKFVEYRDKIMKSAVLNKDNLRAFDVGLSWGKQIRPKLHNGNGGEQ